MISIYFTFLEHIETLKSPLYIYRFVINFSFCYHYYQIFNFYAKFVAEQLAYLELERCLDLIVRITWCYKVKYENAVFRF